MVLIVDDANKLRELDEAERRAWTAYRERLRELSGDAYENAEAAGWQELQHDLHELEDRRRMLARRDPASI